MSYKRLIVFFTFLAIFTMAFRVSVDSDTWWHLRAGAEIVERRAILSEDLFSSTRYQQPWRYPGWLAQLILYGSYQALGFAGLNLFTALMVTIAFAWVWPSVKGPLLLRSALILLGAAASGVYWSARPQILSFVLTGALIFLLERERTDKRVPLWIYPLLMAVWANMHGGFAIGFILIAAFHSGELISLLAVVVTKPTDLRWTFQKAKPIMLRYAWIIAASLIGLCFNPYGPSMAVYPFRTVSIGVLREYIQEWQSPDFHMLGVLPFVGMLFLAFVSFGVAEKRSHPTDYLLVLGFTFMSFWAARNIAVFALVSVIPISRAITAFPKIEVRWFKTSKELSPSLRHTINALLAFLFLLAALVKISVPANNDFNQKTVEENFPSGAIAHLKYEITPAPIFNSYNWGAYLIWELYPSYRSFVDGRTDLFDDEILEQYLLAWRGDPAWSEVFQRWNIQLVLIEPFSPLASELCLAGWDVAYEDANSLIFVNPTRP